MTPTEDLFDPRATGPSAPNLRQTLESFAGLLPAPDGARGTPVGARPAEAPSAPAVELPPRRPRPASPRGASSVAIFVAGLVVGAGALLAVLSRSAPEPAGVAPAAAPAPAAPAFAPLPDAPGPPDSPAAAAGGRALAPAPAVEAPPPAAPAGAAPWTVTRKGAASTLALAVTGSPAGLRIVRARRALVVKLPRARLAAPPGSHAPEGFGRLQIRRAGRGTGVTVPHAPGARAAAAVRDGELQLTVRR
jgi:hypothetical protein